MKIITDFINKVKATIEFYLKKLIKVIDVALDNIVKTIEVVLGKVPQLIIDAYDILKNNLTVTNAIVLILVYTLYINFKILIVNPIILIAMLVAIAMVADKFKVK